DLRIIDINNIEKIELIDKSSIYGGAGEGGIINIKMKKEKRKTFGSYLGTNLTYDLINNDFVPQYNIINLNSNLGKAMLFNNLQMSTYFNNSKSNSTGNFIMNETFYEKETESTSTYRNTDFSDIIGIIFPLGKAQMIIADQVRFAPIHGETNLSQNTFIDTTFNNIISQKEKTNINVFQNFEYIKFSLDDYKNQDLEFSFYHVFAKLFKDNLTLDNISATYYNNSLNINESSYEIKGNGKIALFIYDLKYIYRLSESSQINFHGYFTDTYLPKYLKKHFLYNIINSEFEEDLGGSIKNLSTGLGYAKRFNRFSIDATVNYHFQNIMGHLTTNKNNNDTSLNSKITYHNVEPSIRFKYLINDKNNFNLGYSYSVSSLVANDPNITIYKYIDYIDKSNPTSWTSGNSKLKQELYHKVYFSYKFYKDNINFSTEIFYSATKNGITNISIPINSAIDLTMPENMAFNNRIGTDLSLYYKMSERWNLWLDSQIYHSTFKTNSLDRISEIYQISQDEIIQKSFGANASATIQYKFKAKKIGNPNVYLWADYNSKEITFTGYGYPYFNTNIAFQSNFFNNKLTVWLALTNFFSSLFHQKSYYEYLDVISKTDYYKSNNNMTIKLSLGYNLFAGERGTKDYKL
ncbi:MAG: outer membrane beta-barrel family protein, partial [Bacteroidales bacterium]|nr:outer membrane beta-barrel family protein [Bacteroidales bacterium]